MDNRFFDISVLGIKGLDDGLRALEFAIQRRIVRKSMKESVDHLKTELLLNLSGRVVNERTGAYVNAMERQKIRSRASHGTLIVTIPLPTRAALGIPRYKKDTGYYPAALEYGSTKMAAKAPIRKAVNMNEEREFAFLAADIDKGIDREVAKLRTA